MIENKNENDDLLQPEYAVPDNLKSCNDDLDSNGTDPNDQTKTTSTRHKSSSYNFETCESMHIAANTIKEYQIVEKGNRAISY